MTSRIYTDQTVWCKPHYSTGEKRTVDDLILCGAKRCAMYHPPTRRWALFERKSKSKHETCVASKATQGQAVAWVAEGLKP